MSDNNETKREDDPPPKTVVYVSDDDVIRYEPSVTLSVFICWILPVLVIAVMTRFAVDREATFNFSSSRPVTLDLTNSKHNNNPVSAPSTQPQQQQQQQQQQQPPSIPATEVPKPTMKRPKKKEEPPPTLIADKPTNYIEVVQAIKRRRLAWENTDVDPNLEPHDTQQNNNVDEGASPGAYGGGAATVEHDTATTTTTTESKRKMKDPPRGASSDPVRVQLLENIDEMRSQHAEDPRNIFKLIDLADALRMYDVQYHDGGSAQEEAIESYKKAIGLALETKQQKLDRGEETNRNVHGTVDIPEEIVMDYSARSVDGLLCALYTALGKVFFMSNMFEKAVESYTQALDIEPLYLDATSARGSCRIILGNYEGAAQDFTTVMENDTAGRFLDVFTGLARVLQAKESAVPQGWDPMIQMLTDMIPALEMQYTNMQHQGGKNMISNTLNRLYHVLFLYHDVKTNNTDAAWENLSKSYKYKMSSLPAWNSGIENHKISATKQIFHRGFWPAGVGSQTKVPIFVIGFVRSGSTLLERVLDAHPQIVGTGENSVFNGRLDEIRNKIVETSLSGDANALTSTISSLADGVVDEMRQRWRMVASEEERAAGETNPERYVDKMLTNYYNVGFIHSTCFCLGFVTSVLS
jgi:tetratricopeptide (TPR) repeat protein